MTTITSSELNLLIFRYLHESGFTHSAFAFGYEASINKSPIDGSLIPPGALVTFVQKGLQYLEMEANVNISDAELDEDFSFLQPMDLITKDVHQLRKMVNDRRKKQQKDRNKESEKEHEGERRRVRERERREREKESEKDREKERREKEKESEKDREKERREREKEVEKDREKERREREKESEKDREKERREREKESEKDREKERHETDRVKVENHREPEQQHENQTGREMATDQQVRVAVKLEENRAFGGPEMAGESSLLKMKTVLGEEKAPTPDLPTSPSTTTSARGEVLSSTPGGSQDSPPHALFEEPLTKKPKVGPKGKGASASAPPPKSASIPDFTRLNVFKPDFPVSLFIDTTLCHKEVRNFVSKGNVVPSLQTVEQSLLQAVTSLRFWESVVSDSEVLKCRVAQYVSKIEELQTCICSLEEARKKSELDYSALEESYQAQGLELESTRAELEKKLAEAKEELRLVREEHKKMTITLTAQKEMEKKILKAWKSSVDEQLKNTLDQVRLLTPDLDLSSVSPFKKVLDGKVVDV